MRKLFEMSEFKADNLANKQDKIELLSCPNKGMICKEHLSVVNSSYMISEQHRKDKNFNLSIDLLKKAFYKTTELNEPPCSKCAVLFRSTITESLRGIHIELERMSTGFFGSKRYISSLMLAANVLKEFEDVKLSNTIHLKNPNKHYVGDYLKKKVI